MKRWDCNTNRNVEDKKIDDFLGDIIKVCKKYKYSISHEDGHGAFEIGEYNETDANWLLSSHIEKRYDT